MRELSKRFRKLDNLYQRWRPAFVKSFNEPVNESQDSWLQLYKYDELFTEPFRKNSSLLRKLLSLDMGMPNDVGMIDYHFNLWYQEDLIYEEDCACLLAKLINNWWWVKTLDTPHPQLIAPNCYLFPLVNYTMLDGPWLPSPTASFGPEDHHVMVSLGPDLYCCFINADTNQIERAHPAILTAN